MEIANSAGISLPASLDAAARARRFTRRHLHEWGCDDIADDAQLVVSELVTNMVHHAPHGGYLKLTLGTDRVRVAMTDHGHGVIDRRSPAPHETSGRGLLIVDRLATRWGVDDGVDERGHTVWCDLPHRPLAVRRPRERGEARSPQGVVEATPVAAPPIELNGG